MRRRRVSDDDLWFAGVTGQAAAVASGQVSSVELVTGVLERIQRYDGQLNAFTTVLAEEALAEAAARDAQAGERGPLYGVPVAIKEELDVAGRVTTFGGRGNSTPGRGRRRGRAPAPRAGAVIVGKTHMPEFGAVALHRVGRPRHTPATRGTPGRSPGRLERRARPPRWRPGMVAVRASAATAAARSGSRRRAAGSSASSRSAAA